MVQLRVLGGRKADGVHVVNRFPCVIGRSVSADVRLEEPGVWDRHFELNLNSAGFFTLKACPNSLVSINGQPSQEAVLRNGDVIETGLLKIHFWLSESRQSSLRPREISTWLALAILSAGQIALVYWLLR